MSFARGLAVVAVGVSLAAPAAACARAAAPQLPGHALLVNRPGLRVYGPALHASTPCPQLLALPANALRTVKRALELAMPPYERSVGLDGRNPVVKVAATNRSGFSYLAGGCGKKAWAHSIYASVYLPHATNSASMSQHRFAVGRVSQGWVIWGYIH